jgi:hypothetical protein
MSVIIVAGLALLGALFISAILQPSINNHSARRVTSCAFNMDFWSTITHDRFDRCLDTGPRATYRGWTERL